MKKNLPYFVALALGFAALNLSGCATMFSGTKEEVRIHSQPPEATLLVIGGPVGSLLAQSKKYGELTRKLLGLIAHRLSPKDRETIDRIGVEYFISTLILEIHSGKLPSGSSKTMVDFYNGLHPEVRKIIASKLALQQVGTGSLNLELKRGQSYTVVGYTSGKLIQIEIIDTRFNWTTLWNVLNFGLGGIVDFWTGAWLKLTPVDMEITVDKPNPALK